MMKNIARNIRDTLYFETYKKRQTVEIEGVKLILHDPMVSKRMFYVMNKGYERGDALLAGRVLDSSDAVLEVGSSVGFMALYCISKIGVANYVMVEANSDVCAVAERNFTLNGLAIPQVINAPVCAEAGPVVFNKNRDFWSSSIADRKNTKQSIVMEGETLGTITAKIDFVPNCLIMDIEGAEIGIPIDQFAMFEKLIIEVHPGISGPQCVANFISTLTESGFEIIDKQDSTYAFARQNKGN